MRPIVTAILLIVTHQSHQTTAVVSTLSIGQDQDSLLVKCGNDSHSLGPVIRELDPSFHLRSEFSKHSPLYLQQMRSENQGGHTNL